MNVFVIDILELEWLTACSNVALFVPISLKHAINTCEQDVMSNVEFAVVVEEGLVYVGLDYVGEWISVLVFLTAEALLDFTERRKLDGFPAIGILSWFDYPYSSWVLSILSKKLFEFFTFLGDDMIRFWYKIKRILECNISIIIIKRFE